MPRLVGKRSNNGLFWSLVVVLVAIAGLGAMEYKGYTNLIPELDGLRQLMAREADEM